MDSAGKRGKSVKDGPIGPTETGDVKTTSTSESKGSAASTQLQPPTGNRNAGPGAGALNIGNGAGGINRNKGKINLKPRAAACEVPKEGNINAGPGAGGVNSGVEAGGMNDNVGEINLEC